QRGRDRQRARGCGAGAEAARADLLQLGAAEQRPIPHCGHRQRGEHSEKHRQPVHRTHSALSSLPASRDGAVAMTSQDSPLTLPEPPRVGMVSRGCPKASVDSERILTRSRADGYAMSA
ncbi:hypothetical protein OY671_012190, partial [Metschnikowia pulcherrima]